MRDVISINKLNVTSTVGFDRFKNTNAEPLVVDIQCSTSVQNDLDKSINYASLTNSINQACSGTYSNLNSLATAISRATFSYQGVEALNLKLSKCKGLLKGVVQYEQVQDAGCAFHDTYHVSGIDVDTIIGIHPWERQFKQKVVLDVSVPGTDYSHILLLIENLINVRQYPNFHLFFSHPNSSSKTPPITSSNILLSMLQNSLLSSSPTRASPSKLQNRVHSLLLILPVCK